MKIWLERLGSMTLAVVLLVVLSVVLAAGTIVESLHGAEAARAAVCATWWFYALLVVLALNVLASIATLWPWGAQRTGYLMPHAALVLILLGATASWLFKVDARVAIWEGDARNIIALAPERPGAPEKTLELPIPDPAGIVRNRLLPGDPEAGDVPQPGRGGRHRARALAAGGHSDEPGTRVRRRVQKTNDVFLPAQSSASNRCTPFNACSTACNRTCSRSPLN